MLENRKKHSGNYMKFNMKSIDMEIQKQTMEIHENQGFELQGNPWKTQKYIFLH